jgi:hypothetical protein
VFGGVGRLAGLAGLASAAASVAYIATGMSSVGSAADLDRWIVAWNLLLVPVALWLGVVLSGRGDPAAWILAGIGATVGVLSCVLWATSYERPTLEPVWIGLSAAWWGIVGWLLVRHGLHRLGAFTVVVAAFAALDAIMTAIGVSGPAYALAGPKLPVAWVWTLVVGARLMIDPWLRGRGWSLANR